MAVAIPSVFFVAAIAEYADLGSLENVVQVRIPFRSHCIQHVGIYVRDYLFDLFRRDALFDRNGNVGRAGQKMGVDSPNHIFPVQNEESLRVGGTHFAFVIVNHYVTHLMAIVALLAIQPTLFTDLAIAPHDPFVRS
jgi:hypothetical protein